LIDTVYFGKTPKPVVRDFLGRCHGVWVSEDSLTMVAEAIYSGRPVRSVRPRHANLKPTMPPLLLDMSSAGCWNGHPWMNWQHRTDDAAR